MELRLHTDKRRRHQKLTLENADWTKRDSVLAGEHGLTRERIRQIRKALGLPSSRVVFRDAPVVKCKRILVEHQGEVPYYTMSRFRERFCPDIPVHALVTAAKTMSLKFIRMNTFPFSLIDWRLPNEDLAKVWSLKPQVLARRRAVSAKFDLRRELSAEQESERVSLRGQSEVTRARYLQIYGALPFVAKSSRSARTSSVPWTDIDWLLPNRVLAEIWRQKPQYIAARRSQFGKSEAFIGQLLRADSEAYKKAAKAESGKAQVWFCGRAV